MGIVTHCRYNFDGGEVSRVKRDLSEINVGLNEDLE